jgi:hypothetical protein
MKVRLKEEYRKAEFEFYKIPKEKREGLFFFSTMDLNLDKVYEVVKNEGKGYVILDESGETFYYPVQYFTIVEN